MNKASADKRKRERSYQATRRAELKSEGKCQWCGKNPAKPSKRSPSGVGSKCDKCAQKASRWTASDLARRRVGWAALGICLVCGRRKSMPNDTRCGVCAEVQDDYHARKKQTAA